MSVFLFDAVLVAFTATVVGWVVFRTFHAPPEARRFDGMMCGDGRGQQLWEVVEAPLWRPWRWLRYFAKEKGALVLSVDGKPVEVRVVRARVRLPNVPSTPGPKLK